MQIPWLFLDFSQYSFFPWPSTKFPDFSLTFAKSGISLTFPWPLDTLSFPHTLSCVWNHWSGASSQSTEGQQDWIGYAMLKFLLPVYLCNQWTNQQPGSVFWPSYILTTGSIYCTIFWTRGQNIVGVKISSDTGIWCGITSMTRQANSIYKICTIEVN